MAKLTLEQRVAQIEKRNKVVEFNKAWEVSLVRRTIITIMTYIIVLLYLLVIGSDRPAFAAVVPAVGYFLSTVVLKTVKDKWSNS